MGFPFSTEINFASLINLDIYEKVTPYSFEIEDIGRFFIIIQIYKALLEFY